MKIKHRVRKEELKEDKFQEFVEKVAAFYYANPRRFWTGIAVGLLVIVGVILLIQNRPRPVKNPEAELRLMDAVGNLFQGNLEYAEQALKELAGKFPRDYAGIKAHYYLGVLYSRWQPPRYEEAKREFTTFLRKAKKDPVLIPAALIGIATCAEQTGDYLTAAKVYEKAYRQAPKSVLGYKAVLGCGRCYRQANNLSQAEKIYNEYLKKVKPIGLREEEIKFHLAYIYALKNRF